MLLFLCALNFLQQGQLVVLVEQPQALVIYDRFKNKLDKQSLAKLPSFAAFQVKVRNLLFENGITNAMHVVLNGTEYYILKDKNESMLNYKDAGRVELYKNCVLLNKPFYITSDLKLTTAEDSKEIVPSGTVVQAIFKKEKRVYIKLNSGLHAFVSMQNLAELKGPEKKTDVVYTILNQHVLSVNKKINGLYEKLNQSKNLAKLAPRISIHRKAKTIEINSGLQSNKALFQDLRKLLINEELNFSETDSTLTLWYE